MHRSDAALQCPNGINTPFAIPHVIARAFLSHRATAPAEPKDVGKASAVGKPFTGALDTRSNVVLERQWLPLCRISSVRVDGGRKISFRTSNKATAVQSLGRFSEQRHKECRNRMEESYRCAGFQASEWTVVAKSASEPATRLPLCRVLGV